MPRQRVTDVQLDLIHTYLERAFPGCVARPSWASDADAPIIEVRHDAARHEIEVTLAFLKSGVDGVDSLHHSELADYIHEARGQNRRFMIQWQDGDMRIRSKPL